MVTRQQATAAQQDQLHEVIVPVPVSQSSYLNERDRHYRAAVTLENGRDLGERSIDGVLQLAAKLHKAEADGESPRELAIIEQIEGAFGKSAVMVMLDFMQRPYERW
jgi:hypothetical protein